MEISREDLIRIVGESTVVQAEALSEEQFQNLKWTRLQELLRAFEKLAHTSLFEARRSFLLGLDGSLRLALIRHIFDEQQVQSL